MIGHSVSLANNMNQKNSISAIILSKNEETRIEKCIESVRWADELIVVDNGSTDTTVEKAKKLNAKIIVQPGINFSTLRDAGAKVAIGEWLLYIDADENVTEDLKNEILKTIRQKSDKVQGYYISRKNYYLGCEWPTRDKMIRLMKKEALISWIGTVHEHPEIQGEIGELREPLIHNTHRTLFEMVEKTNEWSEIEAELRIQAKHPKMAGWRFVRVMGSAFWKSYIHEEGWKAGAIGLIESVYQAFSMFITYAKLWERQQK